MSDQPTAPSSGAPAEAVPTTSEPTQANDNAESKEPAVTTTSASGDNTEATSNTAENGGEGTSEGATASSGDAPPAPETETDPTPAETGEGGKGEADAEANVQAEPEPQSNNAESSTGDKNAPEEEEEEKATGAVAADPLPAPNADASSDPAQPAAEEASKEDKEDDTSANDIMDLDAPPPAAETEEPVKAAGASAAAADAPADAAAEGGQKDEVMKEEGQGEGDARASTSTDAATLKSDAKLAASLNDDDGDDRPARRMGSRKRSKPETFTASPATIPRGPRQARAGASANGGSGGKPGSSTNSVVFSPVKKEPIPADIDRTLLQECPIKLKAITSVLPKFRELALSDYTDAEKVKLIAEHLLKIGSTVKEVMDKTEFGGHDREAVRERAKLERHLWYYVSTFTGESDTALIQLYRALAAGRVQAEAMRGRARPPAEKPKPKRPRPSNPGNGSNMTMKSAAIVVMKDAKGKSMTAKEIVSAAIERGLIVTSGLTPDMTLGAQLNTDIHKKGSHSQFVKVGPGLFALRKPDGK